MKHKIISILVVLGLVLPTAQVARADFFGADVAVLTQILANALQQLAQLQQILKSGNDTLGLLQEVNRGINDSLAMAETFGLRIDPGLYRDLGTVDLALREVEVIFGPAPVSKLSKIQRGTDQSVAEAISFNNELNDYTRRIDQIGEGIKSYSHSVSPGGAAKLTAQSMGVMIHVMNQQVRATGQGLKLQAQALAMENKKEKDRTEQFLKEGRQLKVKMQTLSANFETPRF